MGTLTLRQIQCGNLNRNEPYCAYRPTIETHAYAATKLFVILHPPLPWTGTDALCLPAVRLSVCAQAETPNF